jgi:hypothetical protein
MIAVSGVVTFLVPDHGHRLVGVRLFQEVGIPGELLDFQMLP